MASGLSDHMDDPRNDREGGVNGFWVVVLPLIGVMLIAINLVSPGPYRLPMAFSPWLGPVHYISTGILVAVIWAILFRSQLAALRVSLSAIFVLILMEAIYLLAIRVANPYWAM